jgi:hypothetical protein
MKPPQVLDKENAMPDSAHLFNAQLFLDDTWIDPATGGLWVQRQWHQPRKYPVPLMTAEHPWERWAPLMYGSVLHWRGKFRMWYVVWTRGQNPRACYAESDDGVVWDKPRLGLCEFNGSKDNNIFLDSGYGPKGLIDDLTIIDDPDDGEWPLKMLYWDVGVSPSEPTAGIFAARSKDGIRWERNPGLVLRGWGDRFNALPVKQDGKYVVFGRAPVKTEGGRRVWRTESADLVHWSEPGLVLIRDAEDPPYMQFYSVSVFPYEGIYLGGLERMYFSPDKLDVELVFSRDGRQWQRPRTRPSFIPVGPEGSWDSDWTNLPANAPILRENHLWFYYSGRTGAHAVSYPYNRGGIGLSVLRVDGFASLKAAAKEGLIVTPPMTWPEGELRVNFDPREDITSHPGGQDGQLLAEVRGEDGAAITGFSSADCIPVRVNTYNLELSSAPVSWKEGRTMRALAGKRVRLAFRFRSGHLYSFRAAR